MTFSESIKTCLTKYIDIEGRASRSEYWWFVLFIALVFAGLELVSPMGILSRLFYLAVLAPLITAEIRRLHDTNKSGWLVLLNFVPIIGWIILLVWTIQKSDEGANQYGEPTSAPTNTPAA